MEPLYSRVCLCVHNSALNSRRVTCPKRWVISVSRRSRAVVDMSIPWSMTDGDNLAPVHRQRTVSQTVDGRAIDPARHVSVHRTPSHLAQTLQTLQTLQVLRSQFSPLLRRLVYRLSTSARGVRTCQATTTRNRESTQQYKYLPLLLCWARVAQLLIYF